MAQVWLSIEGDDLWRAMMLLNAAAIPTIGAIPGYYGDQPAADWKLNRLTAAVDAESEEAAKDGTEAGSTGRLQNRSPRPTVKQPQTGKGHGHSLESADLLRHRFL